MERDHETMVIRTLCDLHTEQNGLDEPLRCVREVTEPPCDVLVLAGDIATHENLEDFVAVAAEASVRVRRGVVIVLGNHDCYGTTIDNAAKQAKRAVAKLSNVFVLHRDTVTLGGVRFLGCTLWSRPSPKVGSDFADFRAILTEDGAFATADDLAIAHATDLHWLRRSLANCHESCVVVTHHPPSLACLPSKCRRSSLASAFASECGILGNARLTRKVRTWVIGHSHQSIDTTMFGVRMIGNPLGYYWETLRPTKHHRI